MEGGRGTESGGGALTAVVASATETHVHVVRTHIRVKLTAAGSGYFGRGRVEEESPPQGPDTSTNACKQCQCER
jgi:hypothetical protein